MLSFYEIIKEEEDMKYATLLKTILDFTTCILDEKFDAFIRGGYHVSLPTRYKKDRVEFLEGQDGREHPSLGDY